MKAFVIAIGLLVAAPAYAGSTAPGNTTVERRQTTTVEKDDDFDLGWLGLIGLGGLAGLLRKDKHVATVSTYGDAPRK